MKSTLDDFVSIINGHVFANDKDRVFTYIEFVKQSGYENDPNVFINQYKDYLCKWANIKNSETKVSDEDFVANKLIEILKSITLDYSSYEEQDFISHINLSNKSHIKALSALYSRKIRQITEFYRRKRNESVLIVNKNSIKGSKKSIQEIIYEKVFDFVFDNKDVIPSYKNIRRDLQISIEQYVDTYSEYFDIPRKTELTDESRREMLTANMNDVDYRMYLEIELVVSELLYSGNVMLEEIPLIAQLGLDLSQNCVGDMLALKNSLLANTTINLVDINEQIALKRRLYEKFLGTDLWYMYVDLQGNIKIDILCRAANPSGNLLNCGNPDTATIPSNQEELLSHIGLFFKPDKTSILKINAKDYTWTVDVDNLIEDTVYIFPDPNKYGDIGNNKDQNYPLIMEYKMDYDIRNLSSGTAVDDPLIMMTDQSWFSYYSKQDDVYKQIKNNKWEYSFTELSNKGFLANYQQDIWGNEWGLIKGYEKKTENGKTKVIFRGKGYRNELINALEEETEGSPLLLNGGYFENPEKKGTPFDFFYKQQIIENYNWSGISIVGSKTESEDKNDKFGGICFRPTDYYYKEINYGNFGDSYGIKYEDHYGVVSPKNQNTLGDDNIITKMLEQFLTVNLLEEGVDSDISYEVEEISLEEIRKSGGELYVKLVNDLYTSPFKIVKDLIGEEINNIKDFIVFGDNLIIETDDEIKIIPYKYDGYTISSNLNKHEALLSIDKTAYVGSKILFNEQKRVFYILQLEKWQPQKKQTRTSATTELERYFVIPHVIVFDPSNYTLDEIINPFDLPHQEIIEKYKRLHKNWKTIQDFKYNILKYKQSLWEKKEDYKFVYDFEIPNFQFSSLDDICFTYNSALDKYLISFIINDTNGTPYIYEYKFKMTNNQVFSETIESRIYTLKELSYDGSKLHNIYWYNQEYEGDKLITKAKYPYDEQFIGGFDDGTFTDYTYDCSFDVDWNETLPVLDVYSFDDTYPVDYTSNVSIKLSKYTYDAEEPVEDYVSVDVDTDGYEYKDEMDISWFTITNTNLNKYTYDSIQDIDITQDVGLPLGEYTYEDEHDVEYNNNIIIPIGYRLEDTKQVDVQGLADTYTPSVDMKCWIQYDENGDLDSCSLSNLVSGQRLFANTNITSYDVAKLGESAKLTNMTRGARMFQNCKELETVNVDMPKVYEDMLDGSGCSGVDHMFDSCTKLRSFNGSLAKVEDAEYMFYNCPSLESFKCSSNKIKQANNTFAGCTNLSVFDADLSNLLGSDNMFSGCKLNVDSVNKIATTIHDVSGYDENEKWWYPGTPWEIGSGDYISMVVPKLRKKLTLGIDVKHQDNVQIHKDIQRIRDKGWNVTVEWNGTEETISSEKDITYEMLSNSEFNPKNYKTNCKQVKEVVDGIAYK